MKFYRNLARKKYNRLFPAAEGADQAVVMSFTVQGGDCLRFSVYRTIERRIAPDGRDLKPIRRVIVEDVGHDSVPLYPC